MQLELLAEEPGIFNGSIQGSGLHGCERCGPPDGCPLNTGIGVLGVDLHVRIHFEAAAIDAQRALGAEELELPVAARRPALASRREYDAVKPGYSNSASCVSGVSPLSCEREAAAAR